MAILQQNTDSSNIPGLTIRSTVPGAYLGVEDSATTPLSILYGVVGNRAAIQTGATERFTILGTGEVGIGTTTPGKTLDIAGTLRVSGAVTAGNTSLSGYVGIGGAYDSSVGVYITASTATSTNQYGIYSGSSCSTAATGNAEGIRIASSLVAGTANTTSVTGLHVYPVSFGSGRTATSQYGIYVENITGATTNNYALYTAGTTAGTTGLVYHQGNMAIGSALPRTDNTVLVIEAPNLATNSFGNVFIRTSDSFAQDLGGQLGLGGQGFASTPISFGTISGRKENATSAQYQGYLQFGTSGIGSTVTEKARITSAGQLLIGYLTSNGSYLLQVNSQIFATSSAVATSDGRFKENQKPLQNSLQTVLALEPKTFTWKKGVGELKNSKGKILRESHNLPSGIQVGFIAQDVKKVIQNDIADSIVKQNVRPAISDENGELHSAEEFLGIAQADLIPFLVGAIKEQHSIIKAMGEKLETLRESSKLKKAGTD